MRIVSADQIDWNTIYCPPRRLLYWIGKRITENDQEKKEY